MKLLVDSGNTRVKWAVADQTALRETGAVAYADAPDWTESLPSTRVDAVYVASVASSDAVQRLASHADVLGVPLRRVQSSARSGPLINSYEQPERLGVDRWLACIAGQARGAGSVLVADAGTALTLDWVDAQARHGGGLIAPGVASMRAALRSETQLRPSHMPDVSIGLARDTDRAIATGTLRSAISLLDDAAAQLQPDRLLLTGGEAALIAPRLAHDWEIAPHLVLEGLAIHAARDVGAGQNASQASE